MSERLQRQRCASAGSLRGNYGAKPATSEVLAASKVREPRDSRKSARRRALGAGAVLTAEDATELVVLLGRDLAAGKAAVEQVKRRGRVRWSLAGLSSGVSR